MSWFYYALAVPILYSFSVYIDKFIIEKKIKDPIGVCILSGWFMVLIGAGILLVHGFVLPPLRELGLILLAGIFLELYLVPYFKALQIDDTSRVVPLFQLVPVFVLISAYFFLKETLVLKQIAGSVLIIVGGFALAVDKIDAKIFQPRKSLYFMLLASILYSLVLLLFRFVVKTQDFWTTLAYEQIGVGVGACLLYIWRAKKIHLIEQLKLLKSVLGIFSINNAIAITAQVSESFAISLAPVALVTLVSGTQPFFVLLIGLLLTLKYPHILKEDISRSTLKIKVISSLIMFGGLYLLYF